MATGFSVLDALNENSKRGIDATPKARFRTKDISILQEKGSPCYLCMKMRPHYEWKRAVHEHHIFGGSNRDKSEAEGLKVYLCLEHHISGKEAVHNNAEMMKVLRQDGQRAFEKTHTREEFMKLFGKNYLEETGG